MRTKELIIIAVAVPLLIASSIWEVERHRRTALPDLPVELGVSLWFDTVNGQVVNTGASPNTTGILYDTSGEWWLEQSTAADQPRAHDGYIECVASEFVDLAQTNTEIINPMAGPLTLMVDVQSASGANRQIASTRPTGSVGTKVGWFVRFNSGRWEVIVDSGSTNAVFYRYNTAINNDTWRSCVFVYNPDGSATVDQLTLYVDGVEVTPFKLRDSDMTGLTIESTGTLRYGASVSDTQYWIGDTADLMLFHRALSAEEINRLHLWLRSRRP